MCIIYIKIITIICFISEIYADEKDTFFEDFLEKPEVAALTSGKFYIFCNYERDSIIVCKTRFRNINFKFHVSFIHFR